MNPVFAVLLAVLLVSIGLVLIHVAITMMAMADIMMSTGRMYLSQDELSQELQKRWLGRVSKTTYPIAFWWLVVWDSFVEASK